MTRDQKHFLLAVGAAAVAALVPSGCRCILYRLLSIVCERTPVVGRPRVVRVGHQLRASLQPDLLFSFNGNGFVIAKDVGSPGVTNAGKPEIFNPAAVSKPYTWEVTFNYLLDNVRRLQKFCTLLIALLTYFFFKIPLSCVTGTLIRKRWFIFECWVSASI